MTTTKRGHRVGIALAIACLMGVVLAVFGASGALAEKKQQHPQRPADRVRALVLGKAQSPVLDELKRKEGWQISQAANAQGRGNDPNKYDVLVVDGDALSPQQLGEGTLVDEFSDAHRWVLALDMDPADYDQGLVDHTGFTVEDRSAKSAMFLFSRQRLNGSPGVLMLETKSLEPLGSENLDQQELSQLTARKSQEVASSATRAVREDKCPTTGPEPEPQGVGDALPNDVQHIPYYYCQSHDQVAPSGYWKNPGSNSLDIFTELIVPTPGTQTVSWTFNHYFDVYLDNGSGHPQGNFQYVTYRLGGEVTPKNPDQQFFHMYNDFRLQHGSEHPVGPIQAERAWWTQQLGVDVTPDAQTDGKLIHQQSSPETPNQETEYSDEQSFHLGFTASKEGTEFSADYDVKSGTKRTIPDWGVENDSAGNRLHWLFSARHPCDIRDSRNYLDCFGKFGTDGAPLEPNELSRTKLPSYVAGIWRTSRLLSGEEAKATFAVKTPIVLASSRCESFIIGCDQRSVGKTTVGPQDASYSFDISAVNPIPIESLTLAPNPANGTRHDEVTGTVTLVRPALRDVDVTIYSNSENATVGTPNSAQVSQTTIMIPKGQTSATFKVLTNDNKLSPGQHTTATITAFYTRPFQSPQSQLTVVAQKKKLETP